MIKKENKIFRKTFIVTEYAALKDNTTTTTATTTTIKYVQLNWVGNFKCSWKLMLICSWTHRGSTNGFL